MISIVIITYNEEKYLPLLLDSIMRQGTGCEIIVSDNHSRDRTREIARKQGCTVVDGGTPAQGRESGGMAARHDILFLDADVILPDGFLRDFMREIREKNADIATCDVLPDSGKIQHRIFYSFVNFGVDAFNIFYPHVHGQCFFVRRQLFRNTHFNTGLMHGEEHDFATRAMRHGRLCALRGMHVYTSPRRLEKEGTIGLFYKTLYPEVVRFFRRELKKQIVSYEFGRFR